MRTYEIERLLSRSICMDCINDLCHSKLKESDYVFSKKPRTCIRCGEDLLMPMDVTMAGRIKLGMKTLPPQLDQPIWKTVSFHHA